MLNPLYALRLLLPLLCPPTFAVVQSTDATISCVVVDASGKVTACAGSEIVNDD
jgi:hypothetical protein